MATLYLSEHKCIGSATPEGHANQAPKEPSLNEQNIPITGSATSSAPFSSLTKFVGIVTDNACSIRFGGVAAVPTLKRLPANAYVFYEVDASDSVSVIFNV